LDVRGVAKRFLNQLYAFNGAFAVRGQFGAAEGGAQIFEARIVRAGDCSEAARSGSTTRGMVMVFHDLPRLGVPAWLRIRKNATATSYEPGACLPTSA
jgi:hypothetical protein